MYLRGFDFALECSFAVAVGAVVVGVVLAPVGRHGVLQMRTRHCGSHIQCHQLKGGKKQKKKVSNIHYAFCRLATYITVIYV